MTNNLKKCAKCGEKLPKESMVYCPYCNGFFCYPCSLIHPDLNPDYSPFHEDIYEEVPDESYYDDEEEGDE